MEKSVVSARYRGLLQWMRGGRQAAGLTLRELATLLGESTAVIGKIETGERRLDVFEFVQYCRAVDLDPRDGIDLL